MHAVVVRVSIEDQEAARKALTEQVVPGVSQTPGFVAGYWTAGSSNDGLSIVVFESEDAARSASQTIRERAPQGVNIDDVEVREVVAHA